MSNFTFLQNAINTSPRLENLAAAIDLLYAPLTRSQDAWQRWCYHGHVLPVANFACELAIAHGANLEQCAAGALLHDVADTVMLRDDPQFEAASVKIAEAQLCMCGFTAEEIEVLMRKVIEPHSCTDGPPPTLDGKIVASGDALAHLLTDFYTFTTWAHLGDDDYLAHREWVLGKLEKDLTRKIFFEDARSRVEPAYQALKLVFGGAGNA